MFKRRYTMVMLITFIVAMVLQGCTVTVGADWHGETGKDNRTYSQKERGK